MYVHIIDRSNPNEVMCITVGRNGRKWTCEEWVQEHPRHHVRNDICLVNNTYSGRQYCLYASHEGQLEGDLIILDFLEEGQIEELRSIAKRIADGANAGSLYLRKLVGTL